MVDYKLSDVVGAIEVTDKRYVNTLEGDANITGDEVPDLPAQPLKVVGTIRSTVTVESVPYNTLLSLDEAGNWDGGWNVGYFVRPVAFGFEYNLPITSPMVRFIKALKDSKAEHSMYYKTSSNENISGISFKLIWEKLEQCKVTEARVQIQPGELPTYMVRGIALRQDFMYTTGVSSDKVYFSNITGLTGMQKIGGGVVELSDTVKKALFTDVLG